MTPVQKSTDQSGEEVDSQDWQQIPARLTRVEDEVKTLPCQICQIDLTNFVTNDILAKKIKPLASKNDLEVEIGMVTDAMVKQRDLEKLAKLEDLGKLSNKISNLSDEIGKCAKQEDLDNLAAEVNRLSKEVEKCAKQEDLDKLSEKVAKLSEDLTRLSMKSRKFAKKKHLMRLEELILKVAKQSESRSKATNFYIGIATGFLAILIALFGLVIAFIGIWQPTVSSLVQ